MPTAAESCIESSRRLLKTSRYLIAASRRLLNPTFALTGGATPSDSPLHERVRVLLLSGGLPPLIGTVAWAGRGTGKKCCVCGEAVSGSEVEYEPEGAKRLTPGTARGLMS